MIRRFKDVEIRILVELMRNSRRSDREIAKSVGVSQPTVSRIIGKLERIGAIREFTVDGAKTKELPAHQHKYVEALYVLSGKIIIKGQNGEQEVGPGDVVYTYSNELHSARAVEGSNEPMRFLCIIDCVGGGENCNAIGKSIAVVPKPCDGKAKRKSRG